MKTILIISVFFIPLNSFSNSKELNNSFLFNFNIGNIYVYLSYSSTLGYPPSVQKKTAKISDTLTVNNKKYYYMNNYFGNYKNSWIRQDSISLNIYKLNLSDSCTFSPGETLLDSLQLNYNDTLFVCNIYKKLCSGISNGVLFNDSLKTKNFRYNFSYFPYLSSTDTWYFIEKFGLYKIISTAGGSGGSSYGSSELLGCVIDGVVYGDTSTTNIQQMTEISEGYKLNQNFPNPFNPETNISFSIKERSLVKLIIYDNLGKEVAELINEELGSGSYNFLFNGQHLSSGIYYYSLKSKNFTQTKRMVLIK